MALPFLRKSDSRLVAAGLAILGWCIAIAAILFFSVVSLLALLYAMQSDTNQESTLKKVSASLTFVGFGMRPEALTESLGIRPSFTDVSYVARCGSNRKEECGLWSYDTSTCLSSPDVREHIEHLLHLFRPLKSRIEETRPPPNVFVQVRCEPISIMRPAMAPRIDADHIAGLADLRAALTVELLTKIRTA